MASTLTKEQRLKILNAHQMADELVRSQLVHVWNDIMGDELFLQKCAVEFERKEAAERIFHEFAVRQGVQLDVATCPPPPP